MQGWFQLKGRAKKARHGKLGEHAPSGYATPGRVTRTVRAQPGCRGVVRDVACPVSTG